MREVRLLAGVVAVVCLTSFAQAQEIALPITNYSVTAPHKYPALKPTAEVAVNGGTLKIFLISGDIQHLIKDPQYQVSAIVASTNVRFDVNGRYPLVQRAILDTLPDESKKDLIDRFRKAKEERFKRYSITDQSSVDTLLNGAAVEALILSDPIRGKPSQFCFLATDDPNGGTATLPEYVQFNRPERISEGVKECLTNLRGIVTVAMPLIGAASTGQPTQPLRACRMRNALIGDLEGLSEFLITQAKQARPITLREVGIIIWDEDLDALGDRMRAQVFNEMPAILKHAEKAMREGQPSTGLQLAECDESNTRDVPFPPLK